MLENILSIVKERIKDLSIAEIIHVIRYLIYYGYVNQIDSWEDFQEAVKNFQESAGLNIDGEAGPKTYTAMTWPRCGCSDKQKLAASVRAWGLKELTFYVKNRDRDLAPKDWDDQLEKALNQWSDVTNLTFKKVSSENKANLVFDIGFSRVDGFDGPSGTLAYAYLPPRPNFKGQLICKFDASETWREFGSTANGIYLLNVACHEIGHLLGLDHSRDSKALMAPFYNRAVYKPQTDDIRRIQSLYGKPKSKPDPEPKDKMTIILEGKIDIPGYRVSKIG